MMFVLCNKINSIYFPEKEKRSRRKPDLESDDSLSELGGETELDGEVEDDMDTELLDCA